MNDDYGVNEPDSTEDQIEYQESIPATGQKLEIMGLIAMIAGIIGLPIAFCCSILALPFPLASIPLGIISLNKISKNPNEYKGKGFALTGIILGGIVLILAITMFILGLFLQKGNQDFLNSFNDALKNSQQR